MIHPHGSNRTVAKRASIVMLVVLASGGALPAQQTERDDNSFIAFRFDDSHVIAVVTVGESNGDLGRKDGLSAAPVAQYGFPFVTASEAQRATVPVAIQNALRWQIHVRPGRILDATADKIVGGDAACEEAVGVLLTIAPSQQGEFKAVPRHYFVAEAQSPLPGASVVRTGIGEMPAPSLTDTQKRLLESTLNDLLKRELPGVRNGADLELGRMEASTVPYHRSWAAERRRVDKELSKGNVRLSYDVQAFRLDPTGVPTYFVRAEWLAGTRQAFAATLWLRGDRLEIVAVDTGPASWLRMFEFQGQISRIHLGLVLNVVDRDRDGWGEIIFARGGYEGMSIEALEYSPNGFVATGTSFAAGC